MKKRNNIFLRILFLVLGIFIGFAIGAGLFVFHIGNYCSQLNLLAGKEDAWMIEKQVPVETQTNKEQSKMILNEQLKASEADAINSADTFAKKYKGGVSLRYLMAQSDSLLRDSTIEKVQTSYEEIVVKKDEMIAMKTIPVVHIGNNAIPSRADSLLQTISGIHDESKNQVDSFRVELWRSPVNYTGYKMGKNKIVLFGVKAEDEVKMYKTDDAIYLKHGQVLYRISYTSQFRAFERANQMVTGQLK